jgi:hypothetical protein
VSQVTRTFCDICSHEFTQGYWEYAPSHVVLTMTFPAQTGDNRDCKEVCISCRRRILAAFECPVRCSTEKTK